MYQTMLKTFKFRIYPKKSQVSIMETWLHLCRSIYNAALQEKISYYKKYNKSISKIDQINYLPIIKSEHPEYATIHSQVLQEVFARLDKSFKNYFRRIKLKDKPGFPRYKNSKSFNSFCYPQSGFELNKGSIRLSKIGNVKIKQHRNLHDKIRTCQIVRSTTGKWFVCLIAEEPNKVLPKNNKVAGIDLGISTFATFSNSKVIDNPKFSKQEKTNLAKASKKLSVCRKGTIERAKARKIVARIHERINNKKDNFLHQQSKKIVDEYGTIVVEKLNIKSMISSEDSNKNLRREINDASWYKFLQLIKYKAENAGRKYIEVNPANTSSMCSGCGNIVLKDLDERVHKCLLCGLEIDRDLNAAINIRNRGIGINPILRKTRTIVFDPIYFRFGIRSLHL